MRTPWDETQDRLLEWLVATIAFTDARARLVYLLRHLPIPADWLVPRLALRRLVPQGRLAIDSIPWGWRGEKHWGMDAVWVMPWWVWAPTQAWAWSAWHAWHQLCTTGLWQLREEGGSFGEGRWNWRFWQSRYCHAYLSGTGGGWRLRARRAWFRFGLWLDRLERRFPR